MSSIIILIFQFQGYELVSFETIVVPPPPPGEESDDEKPVWLHELKDNKKITS